MTRKKRKKTPDKTSRTLSERPMSSSVQKTAAQQLVAQTTSFSGPIPSPATLDEYNQISPGLADRIVSMAETQATHRREIEHKAMSADISDQSKKFSEARIGQFCALIIGLAAIAAGTYAATNGAQWPGSLIGGGGVIGLVSVFIYGRQHSRDTTPQEQDGD